jgi:hypothetical protein
MLPLGQQRANYFGAKLAAETSTFTIKRTLAFSFRAQKLTIKVHCIAQHITKQTACRKEWREIGLPPLPGHRK